MVTSPLVSEAPPSSKQVEHTNALDAKQTADALTALLLGEAGFKAQVLEDAPPPPPPPQKSPPSPSSTAGGIKNGSSKLSKSSTPSLVVRRRRMELEAQLLLARALDGGGGGGDPSLSCSSFAVRLNEPSRSPRANQAVADDVPDCELCVLRDGAPCRLPYIA